MIISSVRRRTHIAGYLRWMQWESAIERAHSNHKKRTMSILVPGGRHLIGSDTNPADQLRDIPTQYLLDYLS